MLSAARRASRASTTCCASRAFAARSCSAMSAASPGGAACTSLIAGGASARSPCAYAGCPAASGARIAIERQPVPRLLAEAFAQRVDLVLELDHPQLAADGGAVEAGQLVGLRAKLRVAFGLLGAPPLGDVLAQQHDVQRCPGRVARQREAVLHPDRYAVLAHVALLDD